MLYMCHWFINLSQIHVLVCVTMIMFMSVGFFTLKNCSLLLKGWVGEERVWLCGSGQGCSTDGGEFSDGERPG